jgi:hypothetical protein
MTEEEVLALAEKIKQQRSVDAEYARAAEKLSRLQFDISNHTKKVYEVELHFKVESLNYWEDKSEHVSLCDSTDDLIQLLQNYIAEKSL